MKKTICLLSIVVLALIICSCAPSPQGQPEQNQAETCNHTDNEWITATYPTCLTAGTKIIQCDKCGGKTQIIPATGHSWEEATCAAPKTCTACKAQEGTTLAHTYNSKTATQASCTEDGIKEFTCTVCSHSYQEKIQATGHTKNSKGICKTCGLNVFFEEIKEGFSVKLKVNKVGSNKNDSCIVFLENNTNYTITYDYYFLMVNGVTMDNPSYQKIHITLNPNEKRDHLYTYYKYTYLDNDSTAALTFTINNQKVRITFGTSGIIEIK